MPVELDCFGKDESVVLGTEGFVLIDVELGEEVLVLEDEVLDANNVEEIEGDRKIVVKGVVLTMFVFEDDTVSAAL